MKTIPIFASMMAACSFGTSHAQTVLYSENFNGEGTPTNAYDDGTTPEVNVGGIGVLQSTGASQGGNTGDTAWKFFTTTKITGENGLRFGAGATPYNWAAGTNAATILTDGGFSISFDYDGTPATGLSNKWFGVRVGNGGQNDAINTSTIDLGVLVTPNGVISTFDNGAIQTFGTVGSEAVRAVEFRYAFTSWAAGSTVNFTGFVDGNLVATDSFTWDGTDDVKITFGGRNPNSLIDNIVVSTLAPSAPLAVNSITTAAGTNSGKMVTLDFTAPGLVDVYASDDLASWSLIASNVAASPFIEDDLADPKRFYVVVTAGAIYPSPAP